MLQVYKIKRDDWKTAKNNFKKSAKQLEDIIGQQRPIVDNIERLKGITGQLNQNAQRMVHFGWFFQFYIKLNVFSGFCKAKIM